ncbi:MAG: anhydro-N-acetylmuramic acid kinase [Cryomorphaceae bacterium]|nr:anhydro-N-acetylmuramic acid kinase [Cryomorphaceae bacterium]
MQKKYIQKTLNVLGLMSGTSLDGLDMALVRFSTNTGKYELIHAKSIKYHESVVKKLENAHLLNGELLTKLDHWFGQFMGMHVRDFIHEGQHVDLVASHGHTVFHRPELGFTRQIGNGFELSKACGRPVVCDFRTKDVVLGGQGAPLVPRGDLDLFPHFDAWMNLGGMANITVKTDVSVLAWDLAPCNVVFNYLSKRLGSSYDRGGRFAASGSLIPELYNKLIHLPYFSAPPPKSLGREWVEAQVFPLLLNENAPEDLLHTCAVAFAKVIHNQIPNEVKSVLVSGGGAYNDFFIQILEQHRPVVFQLASAEIIEFKEAVVFAYLGYLFVNNKPNVLASVTGASHDHVGGVWYDATAV